MKTNDRLEKIEVKLDKTLEHISEINVTLGKQHVSLEEHIRRTALLEAQMVPVKKHVDMLNGALKLVGVLSTVTALVGGVIKLVSLL